MKIVFLSNYLNHHQKPFCEEMHRRFGADFTFIATKAMREERKKLGYSQNDLPDYVLLSYESEQKKKEASLLISEADAVIAGGAPDEMLRERIRSGMLLLRYNERPFKRRMSCLRKAYHGFHFHKNNLFRKNIYLLCAGAYAARDFAGIGLYKNHTYKWGYFPAVKEYDVTAFLSGKKRNVLMWCGRFIDWKHPDDAIRLAYKLKENGYDFRLNMVGTGIMEDALKQLVKELRLEDTVSFLGSMPTETVRTHMEEAGIYLFTSDHNEGWGAVLNEAMNSGCAVVASHAIGSVPFLIKNNENGMIYESQNTDMLYEKVKLLLEYPETQAELGRAAYETITTEWNAQTAARRLLILIDRLLQEEKYPYICADGPCSKAEQIQDNWFEDDRQ